MNPRLRSLLKSSVPATVRHNAFVQAMQLFLLQAPL